MSGTEIAFRAATQTALLTERIAFECRPPAWRREALKDALAAGPPLDRAADALRRRRWNEAQVVLQNHFASRPRRFPLEPARWADLRDAVRSRFPDAAADAAARAQRILVGRYDLLGYRDLRFQPDPHRIPDPRSPIPDADWHLDPVHGRRAPSGFWADVPFLDPASGDHKVIWELNRHQHWLALGRAGWLTGDPRCRDAFVQQLQDWLTANPPRTGVNWASMLELAMRSLSWIWALHFFLASFESSRHEADERPWLVDLLLGLDAQLSQIARHLSRYFSPNTHLLGEALALYVAGRALPELRRAGRWAALGRTILLEEAFRQVHPDGGHAELSAHYHRYALDFYLLALAVARLTADAAAPRFEEAAGRLSRFARALADDRGRLPLLGDDDGGRLFPMGGREPADAADSLAVAAVLLGRPELAVGALPEDAAWRLGEVPPAVAVADAPRREAALFPQTGYFISRSDRGDHLVLDVGPHGFLNGGHAHADALSLLVTLRGRPFLIDPGTGTYTMDPELRDRLRSSASHNTLTLDGRSQAEPAGPFHWASTVAARLHQRRVNPAFDYVDASHAGYHPVVHRRVLFGGPAGGWLVFDCLFAAEAADRRVRADVHWHLAPEWEAHAAGRAVRAASAGHHVWLASSADGTDLFHADQATGLGWCAPVYGRLVPATTVRFVAEGALPLTIVSFIGEAVSAGDTAPPVELMAARADGRRGGGPAIAVSVKRASGASLTVLAGADSAAEGGAGAATRPVAVADLQTDGRLAHVRRALDGTPIELALVGDATRLEGRDVRLDLDAPVPDLHVSRPERGRLVLCSSGPVPSLQLSAAGLDAIEHVTTNGTPASFFRAGSGLRIDVAAKLVCA